MATNHKVSVGDSFGYWVIIDSAPPDKWGYTMWLCKCQCGTIKAVAQSELLQGRSKSCGCYRKALAHARHIKHGGWKERLYEIWHSMKKRCDPKNAEFYPRYAGREISVCSEWANDYSCFKAWALESGYQSDAHFGDCTLDRIDVNGNYCPENCRWVSAKIQQNNRANTVYLSLDEVTKPLSSWAEDFHIPQDVLTYRHKSGWSDRDALLKPVRKYTRKEKVYGNEENIQVS